MDTIDTYQCCRHCRHAKKVASDHRTPCLRLGCKGSEAPNSWMRLASVLNLFTIRG